jgi:hypothetical protein
MPRWCAILLLLGASTLVLACGASRTASSAGPRPLPVTPTVRAGECAAPDRDGVIGDRPALTHADRDLDGDGQDEIVISDHTLCTPEGNCHWNVFHDQAGCLRYVGTISAARVQRLPRRGEDGFADVRAIWYLTGENRLLLQEYRFRRGGYRIADVLLCRESGDDSVLCAEVDAQPTP